MVLTQGRRALIEISDQVPWVYTGSIGGIGAYADQVSRLLAENGKTAYVVGQMGPRSRERSQSFLV
jgi:hypothetical protein